MVLTFDQFYELHKVLTRDNISNQKLLTYYNLVIDKIDTQKVICWRLPWKVTGLEYK